VAGKVPVIWAFARERETAARAKALKRVEGDISSGREWS
jgi:hypothetical protein